MGVTDSQNFLRCVTNPPFPPPGKQTCTMAISPDQGPTPTTANITVGVDTTGMPDTKKSKWDLDGDGSFEITNNDLSASHTYSLAATETAPRTFSPKFKVIDGATGNDLSEICSKPITIYPAGTTGPPGTPCNPEANQVCSGGGTIYCTGGNTTGITEEQHNFCKRLTASNAAICIYCPPPSGPTGPSCHNAGPSNHAPTVTLLPDAKTVEVSWNTGGGDDDNDDNAFVPSTSPLAFLNFINQVIKTADASHIPVDFFRSTRKGFIGTSREEFRGIQLGTSGQYFDLTGNTSRIYYYQVESVSRDQSVVSNTSGVQTSEEERRRRGCDDYVNVSLQSAQAVSSTATTITFKLTLTAYPLFYQICGCGSNCTVQRTPPYLRISRQSDDNSYYIPWVNPAVNSGVCTSPTRTCGGNTCYSSRYTVDYTIDLPPNTPSDTYTITGYEASQCDRLANIQSASFTGAVAPSTSLAPAPAAVFINTSANTNRDGEDPFVQVSWNTENAISGQENKVYRSEQRWEGIDLGVPVAFNTGGSYPSYRAYDDLEDDPPGMYYYGVKIDSLGTLLLCTRPLYSDQTPFRWRGYFKPWVQTTSGDVHSNVRINSPGGPP